MSIQVHCLKCKTKTETQDPEIIKTANNRYMLKGNCEKNVIRMRVCLLVKKMVVALTSIKFFRNYQVYLGLNILMKNIRQVITIWVQIRDWIEDWIRMIHRKKMRNHQADREMLEDLRHVKPKTIPESFLTKVTWGLIASKLKLGLGVIILPDELKFTLEDLP